jgi:hypothetical protein
VFIGLAGACSLVTLYVAADGTPLLRTLVQAATGVIAGMFLQPSTSGLVALVTVAFSVRALPRRSFAGGTALFALGVAVGLAAMILTSATPARC